MPIDLSILTLSYPGTVRKYLPRLVENLDAQIGDSAGVEVLGLVDNLRMSVGCKWNVLVAAARGKYIAVIGDDDLPADDYVSSLVEAIEQHDGVDCIVFDSAMYRDGEFIATVKWGLEHEYRDDWDNKLLWRYPGELMAIRADIRKKHPYPDKWRGSDMVQARKMRQDLETQHRIDKALYHYYSRSDNDTHIKKQRQRNRRKHQVGEFLLNPEAINA